MSSMPELTLKLLNCPYTQFKVLLEIEIRITCANNFFSLNDCKNS